MKLLWSVEGRMSVLSSSHYHTLLTEQTRLISLLIINCHLNEMPFNPVSIQQNAKYDFVERNLNGEQSSERIIPADRS